MGRWTESCSALMQLTDLNTLSNGLSIGPLTTWQQTEKSQREKEHDRTHRLITESSSDIPSFFSIGYSLETSH